MNSLIAHVIYSSRRYTVIDGCQKQCAVEFLHCHLLPALTKGGFCREYHRFVECSFFLTSEQQGLATQSPGGALRLQLALQKQSAHHEEVLRCAAQRSVLRVIFGAGLRSGKLRPNRKIHARLKKQYLFHRW
jgi:hypothetical protein